MKVRNVTTWKELPRVVRLLFDIRLFLQEEESQENASIILLFEDVNYKVKST